MEYSYSAKEIANYFLELSAKKDISPLKDSKVGLYCSRLAFGPLWGTPRPR